MWNRIPRLSTGQYKRPGIPRIDWTHPLTWRLSTYMYDCGGGVVIDLVTGGLGQILTAGATTLPTIGSTKFGAGIRNAGNGASTTWGIATPNSPLQDNLTNASPYSFAAGCMRAGATASGTDGTIFCYCDQSGSGNTPIFVAINATNGNPNIEFGNGPTNGLTGVATNTNTFMLLGGVMIGTTGTGYFADDPATFIKSTFTGQSLFAHTGYRPMFYDLSYNGATTGVHSPGFNGTTYFGAAWKLRALTDADFRLLYSDPYCFLIYPEDELFGTWVPQTATKVSYQTQAVADTHYTGASPLTINNLTVGDLNNTGLFVPISLAGLTAGTVGVTWNGTALTQAIVANTGVNTSYLYYLMNPDPGNNNLVISWSGSTSELYADAIVFDNVDQQTPVTGATSVTTTGSGYARVQGNNSSTAVGATIPVTLSAAVTSGNFVWGSLTWDPGAGITLTSVTDDKGNSYNISSTQSGSQNHTIYWRGNVTGGPTVITSNFSSSPLLFSSITVTEFSGVLAATDPKDVAPTSSRNNPSGTTTDAIVSGNITTVTNGCLILGAGENGSGTGDAAAGTGFTLSDRNTTNFLDTEYKTQGTAGSVQSTFTFGSAADYTAWVLAVKPSWKFSRVQGASAASASTTSNILSVSFPAAIGVGHCVVGYMQYADTANHLTSITDDKGNTYTVKDTVVDATNSTVGISFILGNITNGPTTISFNFSTAESLISLAMDALSGVVALSDPSEAHVSSGPTAAVSNIWTGSSITPVTAGDLVWAAGTADSTVDTWTAGVGFTQGTQSSGGQVCTEYLIQSVAAAIAPTFHAGVATATGIGAAFAIKLLPQTAAAYTSVGNINDAILTAVVYDSGTTLSSMVGGTSLFSDMSGTIDASSEYQIGNTTITDTFTTNQAKMVAVTVKAINNVLKFYPTADSSVGGWTNNALGTTLYTAINEAPNFNDATYISSNVSSDTAKVTIDPSTSGTSPLVVMYRYKRDTSANTRNLTVTLLEGANTIASWSHTAISTSFVTQNHQLTSGQVSSIINKGNLTLQFAAS